MTKMDEAITRWYGAANQEKFKAVAWLVAQGRYATAIEATTFINGPAGGVTIDAYRRYMETHCDQCPPAGGMCDDCQERDWINNSAEED